MDTKVKPSSYNQNLNAVPKVATINIPDVFKPVLLSFRALRATFRRLEEQGETGIQHTVTSSWTLRWERNYFFICSFSDVKHGS